MVFESIVTDLMNRFLGDFIENLDHKQLNIGIWGGKCLHFYSIKNLRLRFPAVKMSFTFAPISIDFSGIQRTICRSIFFYPQFTQLCFPCQM